MQSKGSNRYQITAATWLEPRVDARAGLCQFWSRGVDVIISITKGNDIAFFSVGMIGVGGVDGLAWCKKGGG